jgi:hypothetical protein
VNTHMTRRTVRLAALAILVASVMSFGVPR